MRELLQMTVNRNTAQRLAAEFDAREPKSGPKVPRLEADYECLRAAALGIQINTQDVAQLNPPRQESTAQTNWNNPNANACDVWFRSFNGNSFEFLPLTAAARYWLNTEWPEHQTTTGTFLFVDLDEQQRRTLVTSMKHSGLLFAQMPKHKI